jgi:nucleoside 2-deoxyribosyltransferase
LIRWLARHSAGPGELLPLAPDTHAGVVGAKSPAGFALVVDHLFATGLLTGHLLGAMGVQGQAQATLSFAGWEYYEQLSKGGAVYQKAFMAMKFGDPVLERMLAEVFRPAAAQAGFELFKLDDVPKAGLIDDRLRVEIQASDFAVADLTHDNLGAYWEAGYAEGLGMPVIYTCEQSKFEATKTHFDTNHHLTIVWNENRPAEAAAALKATIRATLPHLAKQSDGDV